MINIRPKVPVKIEKQRNAADLKARCVEKRLSAEECDQIAAIAAERSSNARKDNRKDEKIATDLTGYDIDVMGCKGELAVCKYLGVDWEPYVDRPDGGVDIVSPWGFTIDVKAAQKIGHRLLFKRLDAFKADIAVLAYAHPTKSTVWLAGWCTQAQFLVGHYRAFECKGSPGMDAKALNPMSALMNIGRVKAKAA